MDPFDTVMLGVLIGLSVVTVVGMIWSVQDDHNNPKRGARVWCGPYSSIRTLWLAMLSGGSIGLLFTYLMALSFRLSM